MYCEIGRSCLIERGPREREGKEGKNVHILMWHNKSDTHV